MLLQLCFLLVNFCCHHVIVDAAIIQPRSNIPVLSPSFETANGIKPNFHRRSWRQRLLAGVLRRTSPRRSNSPSQQQPPNHHLAPYVDDVVLRFNITGCDVSEAKAMGDAISSLYLDLWSSTTEHVDIRLSRPTVPLFLDLLPKSLQTLHKPLMQSLVQMALETYPNNYVSPLPHVQSAPQPKADILFFQDYQPLPVIIAWMRLLASMYPSFVEVVTIGKSYEGREIYGLKVGKKPEPGGKSKKTIVTVGAAHAREWISVSTVSYLAYSIATGYKQGNSEIDIMVDTLDWIFIPTLNVDGYAYTWETDRLWRKNRQPSKLEFCNGIDLDRAYDFHFDNSPEAQSNPCSDTFPGNFPFQAQESRAFADWLTKYKSEGNNIYGLIDFHSYSQQILYPYSYSCRDTPPDLENLEELGIGMAKAIRLQSGEHYEVNSACEGTGFLELPGTTGTGSMLDYMYGVLKVPYTFQIKLRDSGGYGFLLPKENIIPTGEEMLSLLKYLSQWLEDDGGPTMKREDL